MGTGNATARAATLKVLGRHRFALQAGLDTSAWAVSLTLTCLFRYGRALAAVDRTGLLATVVLASMAQVVAGLWAGLYTGRWRFGSFEEVAALTRVVLVATVLVALLNWMLFSPALLSSAAVAASGVVTLVATFALRYGWRAHVQGLRRPIQGGLTPLVVLGAGESGLQVITAMLRDPLSPYTPVALLDDDPAKRNLRLHGVRVVGDRHALPQVVAEAGARGVLVAIPSANTALVKEVAELATSAGVDVKVLPSVRELFGMRPGLSDIRNVTERDLLGRTTVHTDLEAVAGYLAGRRVLVTGAGGSIGSELCRQISRLAPAELIMLDRDESALHAVQLSIEGRALFDSDNLALVDVRDRLTLDQVFRDRRPDVVFHAAALKHLPLLERHPAEAFKSNILGTLAVLTAARAHGTARFVNISTDKAADPISVLGYSKRIAERLTAHTASSGPGVYLSVRFGNVLGSRGSMLGAFQAQIAAGGPVTVTDADVSRFFMTVEEAVELVVLAGAVGRPGEALVLDMGKPVRIAEVARLLVARADRAVEIVYTGLRPGEKLQEVLVGRTEEAHPSAHPLLRHVGVPPLDPSTVLRLDPQRPDLVVRLRALCDEEPPRGADRAADASGSWSHPVVVAAAAAYGAWT